MLAPSSSEPDSFGAEDIVRMWRLTFDVGGPHGCKSIRDEGTLEWVADSVRRGMGARDQMWATGGAVLYRVVNGHPFMDCNHRTGWLLCRSLMTEAGYDLAVPSHEVVRFVKSIDTNSLSEQQVQDWVRQSFVRLP